MNGNSPDIKEQSIKEQSIKEQSILVDYYDEIEIEDMELEDDTYYYPCPCGSRFEITAQQIEAGERCASCPDCPLCILVIV